MDTSAGQAELGVRATVTADRHWDYVAELAVRQHGAQHERAELAALLAFLAHDPQLRHVLEIGAGSGGSAWAWQQLPRVRLIVSVSIEPARLWAQRAGQGVRQYCIPGDSTTAETVGEVRAAIPGTGFDLLVIDGDHTDAAVRADWRNYAPMVRPGGLIVLHDTRDGQPADQLQVSRLWRELAATRPTIELAAWPTGPAGTGIVLA